jgi:hypothetical protein
MVEKEFKKYVLKSNVEHNGKFYKQGSEIKQGEDGYDMLIKAGHAVEGAATAYPKTRDFKKENGIDNNERPKIGQAQKA